MKQKSKANIYEPVKYYLDSNSNEYMTRFEAQIMSCLVNHKTIQQTARIIGVSVRTTEYCLVNLRKRLGFKSRYTLLDRILNSGFMKFTSKILDDLLINNKDKEI